MQVSANTFAQKVSLSVKNAPIVEVFDQISNQTGYNFLFTGSTLKGSKPVTLSVNNMELSETLAKIFAGQELDFKIEKNSIIVSAKEKKTTIEKVKDFFAVPIDVHGRVTDSLNNPLIGATIAIKGSNALTTNDKGEFTIKAQSGQQVIVTFIGYLPYTFTVKDNMSFQNIILHASSSKLQEVLVSTGYQTLPKERATGSFVSIDSALVNRRISTNILDRLDGVSSGVLFNRGLGNGNNPALSIRGRSTIFANADPLIVLDNFPYDGDLNNINPNDIQSISILKDAAAASIWGVRAGNGVIVITTKKGSISKKVNVHFNANTTVSTKPNLYYQPQITSADYINIEQYLFRRGYYDNTINNGYGYISPAVAVFLQKRTGQISGADSASLINQLKTIDVRKDEEKYLYRPAVNQQYALSLDGGDKTHTYYISAGYDANKQSLVTNSYDRFTLNANNNYHLLNDKLQIFAGVLLTSSNTKTNSNPFLPSYPYERLADANGSHLPVVQAGGLRQQYIDAAGGGKLLDWNYRPLDENISNNKTNLTDYKLNANISYKIVDGLSFAISYQYEKGVSNNTILNSSGSYYARNLINYYTQMDAYGNVTNPIPYGGIEDISNSIYTSNHGRAQLNYSKRIGQKNDLNVLGGFEINSNNASLNYNRLYGYDPSTDSSSPVDYASYLPTFYNYGGYIPYYDGQTYTIDRTRSEFFNISDIYDGKYTFSASARRDESNIFGVKANQKGVPLWSSGFMWNISKESFYGFDQLPVLKLRVTYGYNGNVDKSTSAYLTATSGGNNFFGAPYNNVVNPPNPSLRWEKDRNINFGLDFMTKNNLFSGSIDYYIKNGIDLIGNSPIAPQTGVIQFTGNSADTKTTGIDIILNKNSVGNGAFKWQSNFLFSYSKDIITKYKVQQGNNADIITGNYINPVQGFPYNAIFSYPFKGLDNQGKPQGILNGVISEDYAGIENSTDLSNLKYNGSASPLIYGSFRNSFTYGNLDLSVNITYKLDYVFRMPSVFSGSNYDNYILADFGQRWQKPGDELKTSIPALIYPQNPAQDGFYKGSSILVENADNVRLQDIKLSYNFKFISANSSFKNLQVYAYLNNIGIIWKANNQHVDPDYVYSTYVNPRTFSIGVSTNF